MKNKFVFSTEEGWKIEVERFNKISQKAFVGDNYFKTEWHFKAIYSLTGFSCEGSLYTEYDNAPDKWDVIKGLQDKFTEITLELSRYLCQE